MQTPPHCDHHRVDDKRAEDRSVGWRDYLRVASSDDAAGNAGREREDDMARQRPRDHLPRSPQRSPHCSHVLRRPSLAQMMTANSRKRVPARSPAAARAGVTGAGEWRASWFKGAVPCSGFDNPESDPAAPFRSGESGRRPQPRLLSSAVAPFQSRVSKSSCRVFLRKRSQLLNSVCCFQAS
jgi:hypothetical protein